MFSLNKLPFFFKSHKDINNGGFPEVLPFHLYFDEELNMFRQRPSANLINILNVVYKQGSLVEGSISSESGRVYRTKVIDYIFSKFKFQDLSHVLEVGFGTGVLLKELKDRGIKNLTGIEPGDHTYVQGLEGVKLIKDYFPSENVKEKFDLIYSLLVLEHIEDPLHYLQNLIQALNNNGKIIFAIPNCEPYLKEGDISIFVHEHFSYFTRTAIFKLVHKTNFNIEDITIIEGAFIVTISKTGNTTFNNSALFSPDILYNLVSDHINILCQFFSKYKSKDIVIYAPIRALNLLFLINKLDVRLVDDNPDLHKNYLPVLTSPIESFEDMAVIPPKVILIFSRTFGERVKEKCLLDKRLKNTFVCSLDDVAKT